MEPIILEATEFSPKVVLDPANMKLEISGESRPENAGKFYGPIVKWLEQYKSVLYFNKEKFGSAPKIIFEFKFDYLNSISAKYILDILKQLEIFHSEGYELLVKWYYDKRDEDMKGTGEEFAELVQVPFEFIPF